MSDITIEEKFGIYFWVDPQTGEVIVGDTKTEVKTRVIMHRIRSKRRR